MCSLESLRHGKVVSSNWFPPLQHTVSSRERLATIASGE